MNITRIELLNFRNYKKKKFDNFSNLNIIIGKNGIGKTTIIESIYLGSLAKSFKTNNETSIIKEGEDFFKIKVFYFDYGPKKNLELYLDKNGKKTKINTKVQRKLSDFISQYRIIMLSPDELKLIKSSPNTRRNYLNIQISQLHKEYIYYLNNYNNLIKNKNDFLKKLMLNNNLDSRYLDILDEKIVEEGLKIYNYRKNYIELINSYINEIFTNYIKGQKVNIEYESDYKINNKEKILKELKKNRNKDINIGMTSFGIHRDDYKFCQNGNDAKEYSSQGIQKLIILAMKLAEVKIFIEKYDIKPILLLDDLFSELDEKNRNNIFKSLDKNIQVFITTTDLKNINKRIVEKAKIFDLDEGVSK
ncbi:MAG: DNA replication/repair protein RecF [Bacilli bacterium]|nr:DNA replication/repair protein RecF [Bacilli bacterium]